MPSVVRRQSKENRVRLLIGMSNSFNQRKTLCAVCGYSMRIEVFVNEDSRKLIRSQTKRVLIRGNFSNLIIERESW